MGVNDGVFIYYPLAEIQLRGTDRLHCANEYEKPDSIRAKAQRGSRQVEKHLEEPRKSERRKMILMDIEHELRAIDQARLTTDGIHFDSIEGQAWLNLVFQERLEELEAELFDTGVLKEEGTASDALITTFVPPSLETRLGTVPAVTNYRQQSSSEPGQWTDVQDRLGEAPMRRTIHPRRRIGPVNPIEESAGTSRSDTRSDTRSKTTGHRQEEHPAWISISSVILRIMQIRWKRLSQRMKASRHWSLRQPLWK